MSSFKDSYSAEVTALFDNLRHKPGRMDEVAQERAKGNGNIHPVGWVQNSDGTGSADSATVTIDADGITVINGAIEVRNAGSTVIIDGTSNMFKIAASGTITTPSFTQPNEANNTVVLTTGFGVNYDPFNLAHRDGGDGAHPLPDFVPSTLATVPGATGIFDMYECWAEGTSATQTTVRARTRSWRNGGTQAVRTFAYAVFKEAAF